MSDLRPLILTALAMLAAWIGHAICHTALPKLRTSTAVSIQLGVPAAAAAGGG